MISKFSRLLSAQCLPGSDVGTCVLFPCTRTEMHFSVSDPTVMRKDGTWWKMENTSYKGFECDMDTVQLDFSVFQGNCVAFKTDGFIVHVCIFVNSQSLLDIYVFVFDWSSSDLTQSFYGSPQNKNTSVFLHHSLRLGDGWHGCALLTQWKRSDGECVWYDVSLRTGAASVPSVHWLITLLLVKAILSGGEVMTQQRRAFKASSDRKLAQGASEVIGHEGS